MRKEDLKSGRRPNRRNDEQGTNRVYAGAELTNKERVECTRGQKGGKEQRKDLESMRTNSNVFRSPMRRETRRPTIPAPTPPKATAMAASSPPNEAAPAASEEPMPMAWPTAPRPATTAGAAMPARVIERE